MKRSNVSFIGDVKDQGQAGLFDAKRRGKRAVIKPTDAGKSLRFTKLH